MQSDQLLFTDPLELPPIEKERKKERKKKERKKERKVTNKDTKNTVGNGVRKSSDLVY